MATPNHSNLNKMKRQRNIHQVKEHDKCPPNQTRGGDRESTWKRIQNNYNKNDPKSWKQNEVTENSLETRFKKMQEMFNKDLEEIKKESINNE